MKRFSFGLLVGFLVGLVLASTSFALADQPIRLIVNGKEIQCDVPPQLINGRVLVPARFVAEPLGARVEWDEAKNAVVITSLSFQSPSSSDKINQGVGKMVYVKVNGVLANKDPYVVLSNGELYSYARTARDFLLSQNNSYKVNLDVKSDELIVNDHRFKAIPLPSGITLFRLSDLKNAGLLEYTWDESNQNLIVPGY